MNFRQLACFVAVVDEGSFTRAARAIGIAQPSLSQHIRALEDELNGRLIERLPRGIALTPAGRIAAAGGTSRGARGRARPARRARRARARGGRARDRDGAVDGGRPAAALHQASGTSATPTSASGCTSSATARCSRTPSSRASPTSRSGRCRCARGTARSPSIAWEEFVIVAAAGRPARRPRARSASRSSPTASGCSTTRITGSRGSSRRRAAGPGFSPRGSVRTSQAEGAARLASAGLGPALVPDNIVLPGHRGVGAAPRAAADPRRRRVRADRVVADRGGVHRHARRRSSGRGRAAPSRSISSERQNGARAPPLAAARCRCRCSPRAAARRSTLGADGRVRRRERPHRRERNGELHARRSAATIAGVAGAVERERDGVVHRRARALLQARARRRRCRRRSSSTGRITYTNANIDAAMKDPSVKPWTKLDTRRLSAADAARRIPTSSRTSARSRIWRTASPTRSGSARTVGGARDALPRPRRSGARRREGAGRRAQRAADAVRNDYLDEAVPRGLLARRRGARAPRARRLPHGRRRPDRRRRPLLATSA